MAKTFYLRLNTIFNGHFTEGVIGVQLPRKTCDIALAVGVFYSSAKKGENSNILAKQCNNKNWTNLYSLLSFITLSRLYLA